MAIGLRFARLHLWDWRQFGEVEIELESRLTVITGANGAGKTSILNLLGRHFDWQSIFLGLPIQDEAGEVRYSVGRRRRRLLTKEVRSNSAQEVGELIYSNGVTSRIRVPEAPTSISYDVKFDQLQTVNGIYLASHRSVTSYQKAESIPAAFSATHQVLNQYLNEVRQRYFGQRGGAKSAQLLMKEALLASALYGEGNSSVYPDLEARRVWVGFQEILSILLPSTLQFERLIARPPEIVLETGTGSFPIDAISGGISSLLDLAWQIFLRSREFTQFTVCIDEPENHLHPSLQRAVIPNLLRAFPAVHFVVATHSPFIATASEDANVYVLRYDEDRTVGAEQLDFARKAASAESALRDVLGLDSTLPLWAEAKFDQIIARYLEAEPTRDLFLRLRAELLASGLGTELPEAVTRIADRLRDETGPSAS